MQMIMSAQQPAKSVQSLTQGSFRPYGYMSVPPQYAYGYIESGGVCMNYEVELHPVWQIIPKLSSASKFLAGYFFF